jgi:hypothetical protein
LRGAGNCKALPLEDIFQPIQRQVRSNAQIASQLG